MTIQKQAEDLLKLWEPALKKLESARKKEVQALSDLEAANDNLSKVSKRITLSCQGYFSDHPEALITPGLGAPTESWVMQAINHYLAESVEYQEALASLRKAQDERMQREIEVKHAAEEVGMLGHKNRLLSALLEASKK